MYVTGNRDEPVFDLSIRLCNSNNVDRLCYHECDGRTICVCRSWVSHLAVLLSPALRSNLTQSSQLITISSCDTTFKGVCFLLSCFSTMAANNGSVEPLFAAIVDIVLRRKLPLFCWKLHAVS